MMMIFQNVSKGMNGIIGHKSALKEDAAETRNGMMRLVNASALKTMSRDALRNHVDITKPGILDHVVVYIQGRNF
jgi:hypothetical protein